MPLIFHLLVLFVIGGCKSLPEIENGNKIILEIRDPSSRKVELKNRSDLQLVDQIEKSRLYASVFPLTDASQFSSWRERRIQSFVSLFQDHREPYTGRQVLKRLCLKSETSEEVQFHSGPDRLWADCANQPKNETTFGIRTWILCGRFAIEITRLSSNQLPKMSKASFKCGN